MALNPKRVEELYASMKSLLEIWMRIKLVIQKAFSKEDITREHETAFLNLKSSLSRLYRTVGDHLPKDVQFDGDEMVEMMKSATTMKFLQNLALDEKRKIFSNWHRLYVLMTRTFGALEVVNEGYYPRLHRGRLQTKSKEGPMRKKKKRKK